MQIVAEICDRTFGITISHIHLNYKFGVFKLILPSHQIKGFLYNAFNGISDDLILGKKLKIRFGNNLEPIMLSSLDESIALNLEELELRDTRYAVKAKIVGIGRGSMGNLLFYIRRENEILFESFLFNIIPFNNLLKMFKVKTHLDLIDKELRIIFDGKKQAVKFYHPTENIWFTWEGLLHTTSEESCIIANEVDL